MANNSDNQSGVKTMVTRLEERRKKMELQARANTLQLNASTYNHDDSNDDQTTKQFYEDFSDHAMSTKNTSREEQIKADIESMLREISKNPFVHNIMKNFYCNHENYPQINEDSDYHEVNNDYGIYLKQINDISKELYVEEPEEKCEIYENTHTEKYNRVGGVIEEVIKTEKVYIEELEVVLYDYSDILQELQDKYGVFENILDIYRKAQIFYEYLCANAENYYKLVQYFELFREDLCTLYPNYFKDIPIFQIYFSSSENKKKIKEIQKKRRHETSLQTHIQAPLRRMNSYSLLLNKLNEEAKESGVRLHDIDVSIDIVKDIMMLGNTYVALFSIENMRIPFEETGHFIMKEEFVMTKPKKATIMAMLFDNYIIIAVSHEENQEMHIYEDSIPFQSMSIRVGDKKSFELTRLDPAGNKCKFELTAHSIQIKDIWVKEISRILWKQLESLKERKKKNQETLL